MKITLQEQEVTFELRLSERAHGVYLKISCDDGLEVVVPKRYALHRVPEILRKKERWILRNLEKISYQKKHRVVFSDGMNVLLFGREKIIRIVPLPQKNLRIHETENEIILEGGGDMYAFRIGLERYLRRKAKSFFEQRARITGEIMKTQFRTITIRAQKSRWGSCTRYHDLNFNWRLVMMPLEVIDYVVIHELAHTFHHNHSRAFYDVLGRFCPDYKKRRKVLREQQDILPF